MLEPQIVPFTVRLSSSSREQDPKAVLVGDSLNAFPLPRTMPIRHILWQIPY